MAASNPTSAPDLRLELADVMPHFGTVAGGHPGGPCTACLAPDGAMIAAYVSGTNVYVLRVADPTNPAQWTGWALISADGREQTGICLSAVGSTVRLLYQRSSTSAIRFVDSHDNGQSWSSPADLFDPGHPCYGLAADGDLNLVLVAYDAVGLGAVRLAAWQNTTGWHGTDWPNGDLNTIVGIAASRNGDGSYGVALATQNLSGTPYAIQSCVYSPGGTPVWTALSVIQSVDTAVGLVIRFPHLTQFGGLYRLTFLEQDTGSSSGIVYTRVTRSASADFVHWQAATPDLANMPHGAVWLQHAAGQVLAAPETARLAPAYNAATGYRDLTADLLRLDLVEREGEPARVVATLDNSTGIYTGLAALKPNAQLLLSQGYLGAGLVPTHLFYLDEWTFARAADEHSVTLVAYDAARRLTRQTRYPLSYADRSLGYIASDLLALAGFEHAATVDGSAQFNQNVALFQLPPGQDYLTALQRLLAGYDGAQGVRVVPGSGVAFGAIDLPVVVGKGAGQPIIWSYNGEPEHLHLTHAGDRANHLIIYGPQKVPTAVAEVWDAGDLATTGQERYALLAEQLAGTGASAALVAGLALARETRLALRVELAVAPHPGLELLDAITVNDTALPATNCRIIGLTLTYYPQHAQHDLVLTCEGM
jgi:hypothetical protein